MNLQISNALTLLHHHLGDNLLAVHLFGSAVSGGLKPASDIDLLVTVRTPLSDSTRKVLMTDLLRLSAWPATAIRSSCTVTAALAGSVPCSSPTTP
ncbi:nucleotidyltransferase domain-containing protein, partial [Chromobacterium amazonense]|uniref:nucleotidyltransferase domain-containing protein n=1 Tax=Chromobacterium amazonense TaxID=1382803 RepID=UPI0031F65937